VEEEETRGGEFEIRMKMARRSVAAPQASVRISTSQSQSQSTSAWAAL